MLLVLFFFDVMSFMWFFIELQVLASTLAIVAAQDVEGSSENPPEGYYAFVESPSAVPPRYFLTFYQNNNFDLIYLCGNFYFRVRPPPYRHVQSDCPGLLENLGASPHNLCGDLNRGVIPRNPMGQGTSGEPYPLLVAYLYEKSIILKIT